VEFYGSALFFNRKRVVEAGYFSPNPAQPVPELVTDLDEAKMADGMDDYKKFFHNSSRSGRKDFAAMLRENIFYGLG
jgi:hypothetical protein